MGATKESMMQADDACRHRWTDENKYGVRTCFECGGETGTENEENLEEIEPEDDLEKELFSATYKQK